MGDLARRLEEGIATGQLAQVTVCHVAEEVLRQMRQPEDEQRVEEARECKRPSARRPALELAAPAERQYPSIKCEERRQRHHIDAKLPGESSWIGGVGSLDDESAARIPVPEELPLREIGDAVEHDACETDEDDLSPAAAGSPNRRPCLWRNSGRVPNGHSLATFF
jgi:hypothetical protein